MFPDLHSQMGMRFLIKIIDHIKFKPDNAIIIMM